MRTPIARLLALVLALSLVAAACGGDSDDTETTGDEPSSEIDGSGDGAGDGSQTTVAGEDGATDGGGSGAAGGSGGSATPDPGGSSGGSTGGGDSGSNGGANSSGGGSQPSSIQPTAAGRYTYDVDGTRTFGTSTSDVPATSTLEVKAPESSRQRQIQTADDGSSVVDLLLEYRADGAYVVELSQSQSGQTFAWKFASPQLVAPASATPGQTWSWPKTADTKGSTFLEASFEHQGNEAMTVGGTAVDTAKLRLVFTTSGSVTSTTTSTRWISVAHRLTVKDVTESQGSAGLVSFSGQSTSTLRSLSPA